MYGSVNMAPFMFQDDLANRFVGLLEARVANCKVNFLVKQRGLQLNKDKSVCIIAGTKKRAASPPSSTGPGPGQRYPGRRSRG